MAIEANSRPSPSGDKLTPDQISQVEKHGYLFGQKITHSLSPFFHDVIYQNLGLRWGQVRLDSADMDHFLQLIRDPNFYGKVSKPSPMSRSSSELVY